MTVCDEEIPLLLTDIYGEYFFYNESKTLVTDLEGNNYCRKDLYEEYEEKIQNLILANYCIDVFDYDSEYYSKKILLDTNTVSAINKILTTVQPINDEPYFDEYVSVYACDDQMEFLRYAMDICLSNDGTYYISLYLETDTLQHYPIPQEDSAPFVMIIESSD